MARALLIAALGVAALLSVGFLASAQLETAAPPPYRNPQLAVEQRVADLLGRMTPAEKARVLSGSGWMESAPIARLGIPAIKMADGPMGVRNWAGPSAVTNAATAAPVQATAFPAAIGMAASWDPELVQAEARVIAQEVKALGRDMILAPTVNIQRTPLWGRNFEGYGEDPYLAARMGTAYVRGVQAERVIPSVKHFAANNEEFERHRIDEDIDLRTLQEIYFPAFRAAVQEAGAWAVMNAYNRVNGRYCAENPFLLRETLRREWGFRGFVVSDWGSTYSTASTIDAGMNLEMPGGEPMRRWIVRPDTQKAGNGAGWLTEDKVTAALASGQVKQETVDDNVREILRVMFTAGLFDQPKAGGGEVDTPEQRAVARRAATESLVLLKNDGDLLPLDPRKTRAVAVIGPAAAVPRTGGGGSSLVRPKYAVTALDGIKEAAGGTVEVAYALGVAMEGEPAPSDPKAAQAEAVALAAKADAAVVVVGYSFRLEGEGHDRPSMDLPAGQDDLIKAVAAANRNTVVVVMAGAPVTLTGWLGQVRAVLYAWYGGQEAGHAVGDVLFGGATPSGKLPITFPARLEDSTAWGHYPGENLHVRYAEGIYVGYRGFDKRRLEPLFPFGFGRSYTTFEYGELRVDKPTVRSGETVGVTLQVRNRGARAGAEVVQLYLKDVESSLDRPEKELKGFQRLELAPGEARAVRFTLDKAAMSFFHPGRKAWVAEPGAFEVLVGASSRDIRLRGGFTLVE
ncbi:MAG TPA: glycoside hydrolase family 3 C-terminal domain-containing protein [Vicinamibacteria bacterium]|nr:glycoside hydrolase family 3 C-terminal domain-containing protein [Vicinamibacteria bacterium]